MVDKDKKPKTDKALGQDPFEDLFGPEWEEADNEATAAESITKAYQAAGLSEAPDESELEFETATETKAEIDQVSGTLIPSEEPEAEIEPAVETEAGGNQATELSEAPDEFELEFATATKIKAEIDQAFKSLVPIEEPEVETESGGTAEASEVVEAEENLKSEENNNMLDEIIANIDEEIEQSRQSDFMVTLQTEASGSRSKNQEQYVIFTLTSTQYAAPIGNIIEIGHPPDVTPVPNVPDWLLGVTNLRGDILSVVDLSAFLGLDRSGITATERLLVVQVGQETRTMLAGLIVDRVNEISYLETTRIGAPTMPIKNQVAPYLHGIYEHERQLLVVLNLERLLLSPEMQQFEVV